MADGGIGNQSPATLFQARLDTTDGVSATLTLRQYAGNKVVVSGQTVPIPNTGLTRGVADNLIDAAGADAGAPGVANTLYYVYISNQKSPFSPSSIRLSATAPSLVNGVKYLGAAGNALNWRFVGWVQLNATPQFESSLTGRLIVNYYNRLTLPLFTCPNYVDDNAATAYNVTSAVYAPINAGTDDSVALISNGEDAIDYEVTACAVTADIFRFGPGVDSTTTPTFSAQIGVLGGGPVMSSSAEKKEQLSEGFHTLTLLAVSITGANTTVFADLGRDGGTKDVASTFLTAEIFG